MWKHMRVEGSIANISRFANKQPHRSLAKGNSKWLALWILPKAYTGAVIM